MKITRNMNINKVVAVLHDVNVKDVDTSDLWYDWFCSYKALANRGKTLLSRFKAISKSKRFNPATSYIFFKNNYTGNSSYDDFRICDKETKNVVFTVIPRNNNGKAEVWGPSNNFHGPIVIGSWKDVKAFFLN